MIKEHNELWQAKSKNNQFMILSSKYDNPRRFHLNDKLVVLTCWGASSRQQHHGGGRVLVTPVSIWDNIDYK